MKTVIISKTKGVRERKGMPAGTTAGRPARRADRGAPFSSLFSELQIAAIGHLYRQRHDERLGAWHGDHGYRIAQKTGKDAGAINVTLRRLHARGFLHQQEWAEAGSGRLVKRYRLTAAGCMMAAQLDLEGAFASSGDTAGARPELGLPDRAQQILAGYLEALYERNAVLAARGFTDSARLMRVESVHLDSIRPHLQPDTDAETRALALPVMLSFIRFIDEVQLRPMPEMLSQWVARHGNAWKGTLVRTVAEIILGCRQLFPLEVIAAVEMHFGEGKDVPARS